MQQQAHGADQLYEVLVRDGVGRRKGAFGRSHAREADADLAAPEVPREVQGVQAGEERLAAEVSESLQEADADAPQAGGAAALRGEQAEVVVALLAEGVQLLVEVAVVGLLVNGQPVDAGIDHAGVAVGLHRVNLDRHGTEERLDAAHGRLQFVVAEGARRLAGDEEDVAKPLVVQHPGVALDFVEAQRAARHLVGGVESAVEAAVAALVGEVDRRVEQDSVAEALAGDAVRLLRHLLNVGLGGRGEQGLQILGTQPLARQGALDVGGRLPLDAVEDFGGVVAIDDVEKTHKSKNPNQKACFNARSLCSLENAEKKRENEKQRLYGFLCVSAPLR